MQRRTEIIETHLFEGQSPEGQSPDGQSPDGQKMMLYTIYIYIVAGILFFVILMLLSVWSALDAKLMLKWQKSSMFVLWTCIMMMQGFISCKKLLLLRHYNWLKNNALTSSTYSASSNELQSLIQKKYTPGVILLALLSLISMYAAIQFWFADSSLSLPWWDYGVYLIPALLVLTML